MARLAQTSVRTACFLLAVALLAPNPSVAEVTAVDGRQALVMSGDVAELVVDLAGGSIKSFHLLRQDVDEETGRRKAGLNPLRWDSVDFDSTLVGTTPRSMGHFLCLDRWGPASAAETAMGMGWHGEASRVVWWVEQDATERDGTIEAVMVARLPQAGLQVRRTLRLAAGSAVVQVDEAVTNIRSLGRIYNMVQHPTIGPPFLDETTVVDANATIGFMQERPLPNPEETVVTWPEAQQLDGTVVDLRRLTDDAAPAVVSYVIDDEHGWTTAANAGQGLLIGYVWSTDDYPWFDAWRHVRDDKPFARGLEFGTSGLHQPFPVLVPKGRIFDRQLFRYIDAGETQTRSYLNFLAPVDGRFTGVDRLVYEEGRISLTTRGGKRIMVDARPLAR